MRFLCDEMLVRLARLLRAAGYDTYLAEGAEPDHELIRTARREGRILLTRDRRLLMRKVIVYGYCLRSLESLEQVREVLQRFELTDKLQPFHRCLRCNHPLEQVDKEIILERLLPLTRQYFDAFHICPACGQIYWKGSHYEQMQKLIAQLAKF